MGIRKWRSDRYERPPLRSPGRPLVAGRSERHLFWKFIATGMSREAVAVEANLAKSALMPTFRSELCWCLGN
jgi:hypothetical protein